MKAMFGILTALHMTASALAQAPTGMPAVKPPRSPTYPAPIGQKSDASLDQLLQDYEAAFEKGDAKALAALYATDALVVTPMGQLLSGRAAIEEDSVANFAGLLKGAKLVLHPGKTQSLTADVALIEGTYEVTGGTSLVKGRYLNTAVKQNGQWRLASGVAVLEVPAPVK